jgi:acyl dehydratase
MPISTAAAGSELPAETRRISVRDALAYAAGIGDTREPVFDDARGEGIAAPPTYCVSLEWPVVSNGRGRQLLGADADELVRGVHASQDSHFHRPIRPGDSLTTRGRYAGVRATRAGALLTTCLETVDGDGRPVVTSWSRSIFRGVGTEGANAEVEPAPSVPRVRLNGTGASRSEIFVPREMPHVYTECARIWNPIHTEREVALRAGLPDIILHGTATWALAAREMLWIYGDGDPARLKRLHGRFTAMVIPGTSITVEHAPGDREGGARQIAFRVLNAQGQEAVSQGVAVVA